MAKSLDINRYPPAYFEILRGVAHEESRTITFSSAEEAQAFRFDYYAFLKALRRSHAYEHKQYVLIADNYKIQVRGRSVSFTDRNKDVFATAIMKSLAENPPEKYYTPDQGQVAPEDQADLQKLFAIKEKRDSDAILASQGYTTDRHEVPIDPMTGEVSQPSPSPSPTRFDTPTETKTETAPTPYEEFMRRNDND